MKRLVGSYKEVGKNKFDCEFLVILHKTSLNIVKYLNIDHTGITLLYIVCTSLEKKLKNFLVKLQFY